MSHIHPHQTPEMHDCIHACEEAHDLCLHAIHDCLQKGGPHADAHHIGLLQDCAQICHTAHDFMLRHSHHHTATCRACAEICAACAESCEKLGDTACAAACAKCVETCAACAKSA